jgi:predicted kinase
MPAIELLIGMIGSGKSTYALGRAKEGALIVCRDALTAMLHGEYRYEQGLRECYRQMEEAIVFGALSCVGRDAVIDRTHLTRESRSRWIGWARKWGVPIIAITFPIWPAHVHATRRHHHDARGRTYLEWHRVAIHHAAQAAAEPLDWQAEGFDDMRTIEVPPWPSGLSEQTADYLMKQP